MITGSLANVPVLQALTTSQTFKSAIDHNSQTRTEGLTLLHTEIKQPPVSKVTDREDKTTENKVVTLHLSSFKSVISHGSQTDLCEVKITERPSLTISRIRFHKNRRA